MYTPPKTKSTPRPYLAAVRPSSDPSTALLVWLMPFGLSLLWDFEMAVDFDNWFCQSVAF